MARKSNKTSHVLNLLAGTDVEDDAQKDSTISIVDNSQSAKDPVSDIIKDNLLDTVSSTVETLPDESVAVSNVTTEPVVTTTPVSAPIETPATPTTPVAPTAPAAPTAPVAPTTPVLSTTEFIAEKPTFAYINVMERIVQDKAIYFIKEFNMCSCERCVIDTIALALTHLPPKYIVADTSSISPLLNYYTNKYIGQVTVELTKACMAVKNSPHH